MKDIGLNQLDYPPPLVNVLKDISGFVLSKSGQDFSPCLIVDR